MKILFMLKSDCGNLAMVHLYNAFKKKEIYPDVCSFSFRSNDIQCFENIPIMQLHDVNIHDYDVLIVARNIYDYPLQIDDILHYSGIIISDNTTLYEGDDVYGDIVFTSGRNNYDTQVKSGQRLPTVLCGCLKVKNCNLRKSDAKKIVWIESGHFPYGEVGRKQEADIIRKICTAFPQYQVVIKPRYLISDCAEAKHSNTDHLYFYLSEVADKSSNLLLLKQHYAISDVIEDAELVIHTYSSAFQEAILLNKGVINIGNIDSEETIDLRRNRFKKIRMYIDKAGQTCNLEDVLSKIPAGIPCTQEYKKYIIGTVNNPVESMIDTICMIKKQWDICYFLRDGFHETISDEDFAPNSREWLRRRRIQGAIHHVIARFEYNFDEYVLFQHLRHKHYGDKWQQDVMQDIKELISLNFSFLNQNVCNQAYLMYLEYQDGRFDPQNGWPDLKCYEAFFFFSGKLWASRGNTENAVNCLKKYLSLEDGRKYPKTIVDKQQYIEEASVLLTTLLTGINGTFD